VSRPIFFTENGSGSEIAGNGTGTGINGYMKMNKYERKYNKIGENRDYTPGCMTRSKKRVSLLEL
jgi:hypothetical protein